MSRPHAFPGVSTVRLSSGEAHEVRHNEFAILLRSGLVIGFPGTDRFAICSLLHIVAIETVQAA